MTQFIKFGLFIIKKEEIKFAEFIEEKKQIRLLVSENGDDKQFVMDCDDNFDFNQICSRLALDLEPISLDRHWKHEFIEQLSGMRSTIRNTGIAIEYLKREIKILKKYIYNLNKKEEKV